MKIDPRSTAELFEAAAEAVLLDDDDHPHPAHAALVALQERGTREVLETAVELCDSASQDDRLLGVAVLAELCEAGEIDPTHGGWRRAFVDESVSALVELAEWETDDEVLAQVMRALGCRRSPRGLLPLLSRLEHPAQPVRFHVGCALPGCATPETEDLVAPALIQLTRDEDTHVRDYALFGFPQLKIDSEEIRQAMFACIDDDDPITAGQALISLAWRRDERAIAPLIAFTEARRHLSSSYEAAGLHASRALLPALRATGDDPASNSELADALQACETETPIRHL